MSDKSMDEELFDQEVSAFNAISKHSLSADLYCVCLRVCVCVKRIGEPGKELSKL